MTAGATSGTGLPSMGTTTDSVTTGTSGTRTGAATGLSTTGTSVATSAGSLDSETTGGTTGSTGATTTGGAATTSGLTGNPPAAGEDGGSTSPDGGGDTDAEPETGPFQFVDDLTMGATVPPRHKCPASVIGSGMGDNLSPPLAWSGAPAGTQSFAVILFDTRYNLFHWALWDIPGTARSLPEGIPGGYEVADPAGAHQGGTASRGEPNSYFGPCSDAGPSAGTYEYRLFALSAATLDLPASASGDAIESAVDAATLEALVWEGTPE